MAKIKRIRSERNHGDLNISVDKDQEWTDEELKLLKSSFFESLDSNALDLFNAWRDKTDQCSLKLSSYFQAYAEQLQSYRGSKCTLVEIGVMEGGSLLAWKDWLGQDARVIGIDINPEVKEFEKQGVEIVIGNQADPSFWNKFFDENPDIDIIIDDGGHQYFQQAITFFCVLYHAKKKMRFFVEDTYTSFMSNFIGKNTETFVTLMKQVVDNLYLKQIFSKKGTAHWKKDVDLEIVRVYQKIQSLSFFPGLISMTIDPRKGLIPLYLYNISRRTKRRDHRFSGDIAGVKFPWPDPINPREEIFSGSILSEKKMIVTIHTKHEKKK